jgi:hypothetical protein
MNSAEQQREMAEFLNSAARNLRKYLECDATIRADEIDAVVNRLPQLLREAACRLTEYESDEGSRLDRLGITPDTR